MTKSKLLLLAALAIGILSVGTGVCQAQFNIDNQRWAGPNTALSQSQGYDQGDPLRLTWGIAQEGMTVGQFSSEADSPNIIRAFFDGIHGAGSETTVWRPMIESTFDRWGSISGLDYSYEAADDGASWVSSGGLLGARADVRLSAHSIDGQVGTNTLAYNFFPDSADQVIDSDNTGFFSNSANSFRGTRNVLAHETGHGLGMSHLESSDTGQLMEPFIGTSFDGPQYFDILSAQRGYGDFNEKSFGQLGNDVATRATDLGTITDGGTAAVGQDASGLIVNLTDEDFVSIDDNTDTDFFKFSVAGNGTVDIDLDALGFTFNVGSQGGMQNPFDTTLRSDLKLELFDSGLTSMGFSDMTTLGGSESFSGINVTAGDYFIRVTGSDNTDTNLFDVQFYGLSTTFNMSAVPEPTSATLFLVGIGILGFRRRRG